MIFKCQNKNKIHCTVFIDSTIEEKQDWYRVQARTSFRKHYNKKIHMNRDS